MDSAVYVLALVLAITMVISALSNQIRQNKVTQERYRNFNADRFKRRGKSAPKRANFGRKFSTPHLEVRRPPSSKAGFFSGIFNNTTPPVDRSRGFDDDRYSPDDDRYSPDDGRYNPKDTRSDGPTQDDLDRIRALKSKQDREQEQQREMENHQQRFRECKTKADMVKDKVEILHNNLDIVKNERPVFSQDGRTRVEGKLNDAQRTMNELRDILNDSGKCTSIDAPITTQPVYDGYK